MFFGCSTTKPSITEYKLSIYLDETKGTSMGCKDKSIKVVKAFSDSSLMSPTMDYVQADTKVYAYSKSQWMNSPKNAISKEIFLNIRDMDIFKNVNIAQSVSTSDWILEITIEDFVQYYNKEFNKSYVNAVVSLNIIDTKTSQVIASKKFSSKVDTKPLNAEGGVDALSEALQNILKEQRKWFDEVCR
jgi:cholesterol transport system auxiliary component